MKFENTLIEKLRQAQRIVFLLTPVYLKKVAFLPFVKDLPAFGNTLIQRFMQPYLVLIITLAKYGNGIGIDVRLLKH